VTRYFYPEENVDDLTYSVRIDPTPPADEGTLQFRKHSMGPGVDEDDPSPGDVLKDTTDIELKGENIALAPFVPKDLPNGPHGLDSSPICLVFTWKKNTDNGVKVVRCFTNLSLAELAVKTVSAPLEVKPDEGGQKAEVAAWAALAYDLPDADPTEFDEPEPERAGDAKQGVKWALNDEVLSGKTGLSLDLDLKDHAGTKVRVEAFLGDEPTGRAVAEILVPVMRIVTAQKEEPPESLEGLDPGFELPLTALTEPPLKGTFTWKVEGSDVVSHQAEDEGLVLKLDKPFDDETPLTITCTLRSEAGKDYEATYEPKLLPKQNTLRLRLEDDEGNKLSGATYKLEVGDKTFEGTVGDDGYIVHDVPATTQDGKLTFQWDDEDHEMPIHVADHVAQS
jgi:hypothetical protein